MYQQLRTDNAHTRLFCRRQTFLSVRLYAVDPQRSTDHLQTKERPEKFHFIVTSQTAVALPYGHVIEKLCTGTLSVGGGLPSHLGPRISQKFRWRSVAASHPLAELFF